MGERTLLALVLVVSLTAGAFLHRLLKDLLIPTIKEILGKRRRKPEECPVVQPELREWLIAGRQLLNDVTPTIDKESRASERLEEGERNRLWIWFWAIIGYLLIVGSASGWWVFTETMKGSPHRARIAVVAGIFGSCIAAFRSCLDRRASGFEDQYGNVAPGREQKERFSDGMVVWFLGRPALGGMVALLVYFGLNGGIFSEAAKNKILESPWEFLFYLTLVGLFAKTILDLLIRLIEQVFHV